MRRLKPSQLEVFLDLVGADQLILNSPTGWGKTTVLIFLALERLRADPHAKVLIIVPQRIIGKGFLSRLEAELPGGGGATWRAIDLCQPSRAKIRRLVAWLRAPADERTGRVVVTTHAAFVAAYARVAGDADAFRRTIIGVDEGHHIQVGDAQADDANRLGRAVDELLDRDVPNWLATAFFFRGDRLPILNEARLAAFRRAFVPFDRHLAEMVHLRSYAYDFVTYKQSIFPDVESLLGWSQAPTLIYCPPEGHAVLQSRTKASFVGRIADLIWRHYPGSLTWTPDLPPAPATSWWTWSTRPTVTPRSATSTPTATTSPASWPSA